MEVLDRLQSDGLYRTLQISSGIDFCSNDYLGLTKNADLKKDLLKNINHYDLGSTGSSLISGYSPVTVQTEQFLAQHFNSQAALILGSGYLCNLSVMQALGDFETEFFSDEYNHASLIDGMRLSKSKISIFKHNDLQDLKKKLTHSNFNKKVIVTESIFSMDGDGPDLKILKNLSEEFETLLVIDEAHATGVCGPSGNGLVDSDSKTVVIHTAGKALGGYGAFVTCSTEIKNLIVNRGRGFIYSTALPPFVLFQIHFTLIYLSHHPELRERLKQNVELAKTEFAKLDLNLKGNHIGNLICGSNESVLRIQTAMKQKGFAIAAIRSPTVPKGEERLRLTFKSFHQPQDIKNLALCLREELN